MRLGDTTERKLKLNGQTEDVIMFSIQKPPVCETGGCEGWLASGANSCTYTSSAPAGEIVYATEADCRCGAYGLCPGYAPSGSNTCTYTTLPPPGLNTYPTQADCLCSEYGISCP